MSDHVCGKSKEFNALRKTVTEIDKAKSLDSQSLKYMQEDITQIKATIEKNNTLSVNNHNETIEKIEDLIAKIDTKYATKDNVRKLWAIVWSIIGFVFTALGTIIVSDFIFKHQ